MLGRDISRRQFLRITACGVGAFALSGLLQACGGDDDDDDSDGETSGGSVDNPAPTATSADEGDDDEVATEAEEEATEAAEVEDEGDEVDKGGSAEASDATVVVATIDAFQSLDPHFTKRPMAKSFAMLIMERLVEPAGPDDLSIVPKLATAWEVADDATTWTFTLREGVVFHDGEPFNAEAVVYSLERMRDPDVGGTEVTRISILDTAEATDELTVTLKTKTPYAEFLLNLSDPAVLMFSPTWAAARDTADYGREPVGTGPFKFDRWLGPEEAVVVPFENYWGEPPKVGRIIGRQIPDAGALVAALEAGEVDVTMDVPPSEVERLRSNPDLVVTEWDGSSTNTMGCLTTKEPFNHVPVRKALNHAIDKQTICDTIFSGLARPTTTPLYPGNMYRVELGPYEYNPELARELLAEAGYPDGFNTKILLPSTSPTMEACQAIAQYFEAIGVKAELQIVEDAVWSQLVRAHDDERDLFYQAKSGIGVDYNLNRLYSDEYIDEDNRGRWVNERVLELLDLGRKTFDEDERQEIYGEIQQIIWEEAVEIFLWSRVNVVVANAKVDNVPVVHDRMIINNVTKSA